MEDEWFWVAILCAAPFVVFGLIEIWAMMRRRKAEAVARRSKAMPQGGRR